MFRIWPEVLSVCPEQNLRGVFFISEKNKLIPSTVDKTHGDFQVLICGKKVRPLFERRR